MIGTGNIQFYQFRLSLVQFQDVKSDVFQFNHLPPDLLDVILDLLFLHPVVSLIYLPQGADSVMDRLEAC